MLAISAAVRRQLSASKDISKNIFDLILPPGSPAPDSLPQVSTLTNAVEALQQRLEKITRFVKEMKTGAVTAPPEMMENLKMLNYYIKALKTSEPSPAHQAAEAEALRTLELSAVLKTQVLLSSYVDKVNLLAERSAQDEQDKTRQQRDLCSIMSDDWGGLAAMMSGQRRFEKKK